MIYLMVLKWGSATLRGTSSFEMLYWDLSENNNEQIRKWFCIMVYWWSKRNVVVFGEFIYTVEISINCYTNLWKLLMKTLNEKHQKNNIYLTNIFEASPSVVHNRLYTQINISHIPIYVKNEAYFSLSVQKDWTSLF